MTPEKTYRSLHLTGEVYSFIEDACERFQEKGGDDVEVNDILFTYIFSPSFKDDERSIILNDWDEGENNDPLWNKERNQHSAYCFILDTCKEIEEKFGE